MVYPYCNRVFFEMNQIDLSIFEGNFIEEVAPLIQGKRKRRQVKLKCLVCFTEFVTSYDNAKRTKQKTCSNKCAGIFRQGIEGGCENHPLYPRWLSMRDRCNNPNNARYARYGARGIKVSPLFDSFKDYVACLSGLENCPDDLSNTNLQVDRINNDLGYFPENLRWVSSATNSCNKTHSQDYSTSKFRGIYYCNTFKRWIASVTYKGKKILSSHHKSEKEALLARNEFIQLNKLPHPLQQFSDV